MDLEQALQALKEAIAEIAALKKEISELKTVYVQVLRDAIKRVDKAYQAFFRRIKRKDKAGFPRYKSLSRYNSFTYTQLGFKFVNGKLRLSKIGDLKIKL